MQGHTFRGAPFRTIRPYLGLRLRTVDGPAMALDFLRLVGEFLRLEDSAGLIFVVARVARRRLVGLGAAEDCLILRFLADRLSP